LDPGLKAPITLPLGHVGSIFKMASKVIDSVLPGKQNSSAESTAGFDIGDAAVPFVHTSLKLRIVHESKVLVQMILSEECSLLWGLFLTADVVVCLEMIFVWIGDGAKDTTKYTILLCYAAVGRTSPLVQNEMH
jgi:hypothetical protein